MSVNKMMPRAIKAIGTILAIAILCLSGISGVVFASGNYGDGTAEFPDVYPANKIIRYSDYEIEQKVQALLLAMTEDEKFAMLGGSGTNAATWRSGTGIVRGVPRLGVPLLRMWDGPKGVIAEGNLVTTAPSSEISLASSFDRDLAYRYGEIHGRDNKATGGNVQLGVQMDHVRSPFFVRSRDSFGEDPFLSGAIGTQVSQGVEDHNVISTLKHMAGYSYQFTRTDDDFIIDEQTLHECFLAPYEMIAKNNAASGIMASYNLISNRQTNESAYLLKNVLHKMWGFTGLTMTDWAACKIVTTHLGLDLEMGSISRNNRTNILAEIAAGRMAWDDVDQAVHDVLYAYGKIGYLGLVEVGQSGGAVEDPTPPSCIELPRLEGGEREALMEMEDPIALESSVKGAVLLKNENNALPIKSGSVAFLGMTSNRTLTGHYRESAFGWLPSMTSPYENMAEIYKGGAVYCEPVYPLDYAPVPESVLFTDETGSANGVNLVKSTGSAVIAKAELTVGTIGGKPNRTYKNSADGNALPNGGGNATMTTWLKAPETGEYRFKLLGIGGSRSVAIAGIGTAGNALTQSATGWATTGRVCTPEGMDIPAVPQNNNNAGEWPPAAPSRYEIVANLVEGELYQVTITVNAGTATKDGQARLVWQTPSAPAADYANGIRLAEENDTVVIFVDDIADNVRNYRQRYTLALESKQSKLINDAADAAKAKGNKVVVVLNIALPVTMDWIDKVDAVLCMWLPGQAGGLSTAQLLAGVENPSGKTVVTFPKRDTDTQHGADMFLPISDENNKKILEVTEGIFSGYRWYDKSGIAPLFDFGYGLSYTSFEYSGLELAPVPGKNDFTATFTVKNTGPVAGSEIAQVYLGAADVPEGIQMAKYSLAEFVRIEDLEPGESRTVTGTITERQLSYWDDTKRVGDVPANELIDESNTVEKWVLAEGERKVYVGGRKPVTGAEAGILSATIDVRPTEAFAAVAGISAPAVWDINSAATLSYGISVSKVAAANIFEISARFDSDKLAYVGSKIAIPSSLSPSYVVPPSFNTATGEYRAVIYLAQAGAMFTAANPQDILSVDFMAKAGAANSGQILGMLTSIVVHELTDGGLGSTKVNATLDPSRATTAIVDYMRFDVNGDGVIDFSDLSIIIFNYYLARAGDSNWAQAVTFDANYDGIIDLGDLLVICSYFS